MNIPDVTGGVLVPIARAILDGTGDREPLYRELLKQPLCMAHLAHEAAPGPALRLSFGETIRLVESPILRVPVAPLYLSHAAMTAAGAARAYWPDGIERGAALDRGAAFPLLRGQAGTMLFINEHETIPLDAGDVAVLADGITPADDRAALRALVEKNRRREVALRIAKRPLYVLGHPRGGLLMFERDLPCFFHLAAADSFAQRIAEQSGQRAEHGLVAASDLYKNAFRGKLNLVINPGPDSITLRPVEMRF